MSVPLQPAEVALAYGHRAFPKLVVVLALPEVAEDTTVECLELIITLLSSQVWLRNVSIDLASKSDLESARVLVRGGCTMDMLDTPCALRLNLHFCHTASGGQGTSGLFQSGAADDSAASRKK